MTTAVAGAGGTVTALPPFTRGEDIDVHWPLFAAGTDTPFDPTGATARAELRFDVLDPATPALAVWTSGEEGAALRFDTDDEGRPGVRLTVPGSVTAGWAHDGGVFDIRARNTAGQTAYPITSTVRLRTPSTRS